MLRNDQSQRLQKLDISAIFESEWEERKFRPQKHDWLKSNLFEGRPVNICFCALQGKHINLSCSVERESEREGDKKVINIVDNKHFFDMIHEQTN